MLVGQAMESKSPESSCFMCTVEGCLVFRQLPIAYICHIAPE